MDPSHYIRIIFSAVAVVLAGFAFADNSVQLELRGLVPVNCTVNVNPSVKAGDLNIANGESNVVVGTLTENCNAGNGYVVSIASLNKGKLINPANTGLSATYQVQYDTAEGTIANNLTANRNQAQFARQGKLAISFNGQNQQVAAGTYSDTLNIIISAK
jgi:spore coat protein U-like protein